jgi:hypothetical protein
MMIDIDDELFSRSARPGRVMSEHSITKTA